MASKKSKTIAFRVSAEEFSALDGMRKPDQRMSDIIRELVKERNNERPNPPDEAPT